MRLAASLLLVSACAISACAAERARGPLLIPLGISRAETTRALRSYDFCASDGRPTSEQVFPQCERPGLARGDAWVIARFRDGTLARLQRFERWADPSAARARWDQLIARHSEEAPPSDGAREQLVARQQIPSGTQAWVAFSYRHQLIGLYLLTPATAEDPSVLEEILPALE